MITKTAIENLLIWAKYTAKDDDDLYEMADLVSLVDDVGSIQVSQFIGLIDAGSAQSYIEAIKRQSAIMQEELDEFYEKGVLAREEEMENARKTGHALGVGERIPEEDESDDSDEVVMNQNLHE